MADSYRLVNAFIADVLAKADIETATWDEFYGMLSDEAKSGYTDLIDWVCGYEDLENAEKYIDIADIMESITDFEVTAAEELINRTAEQVMAKITTHAEDLEYEHYCSRADYAYDNYRDEKYHAV